MSTIMQAWDVHERGGKPEMANVLNKFDGRATMKHHKKT